MNFYLAIIIILAILLFINLIYARKALKKHRILNENIKKLESLNRSMEIEIYSLKRLYESCERRREQLAIQNERLYKFGGGKP